MLQCQLFIVYYSLFTPPTRTRHNCLVLCVSVVWTQLQTRRDSFVGSVSAMWTSYYSVILGRVANPRPVARIKTGRVSQPITDAADVTGRDWSWIATRPWWVFELCVVLCIQWKLFGRRFWCCRQSSAAVAVVPSSSAVPEWVWLQ